MDLRPTSPTTTLTNALPKMYDNWQEFYKYWNPWVLTTGQRHLSITQLENGVVYTYEIDWKFVVIECHKVTGFWPFVFSKWHQYKLYIFLRNFWRKVGLPAG